MLRQEEEKGQLILLIQGITSWLDYPFNLTTINQSTQSSRIALMPLLSE